MKLIFAKSKWEMWNDPLEAFLQRARGDGFDAVEVYLPAESESATEIKQMVAAHGLKLIAQITTEGNTPDSHLESIQSRINFAAETEPLFINSHTGRDIFGFQHNCSIIREGNALARSHGLRLRHETHRGRPTYNAVDTVRYLDAMPDMQLTADFAHWFCVHESDLSDQPENISKAISRTGHIHARVGHEQGSQVADPLANEWLSTTGKFIELWRRIIDEQEKAGADYLTITPEFGPPPYMPCEPHTKRQLADAWKTNVVFLQYLKSELVPEYH